MVHLQHGLHGLASNGVGILLAEVLGGAQGHDGLVAGDGGQQLHTHGEDPPAAEGQQHHRRQQGQGAVPEAPLQTLGVLVLDLVEPLQLLGLGLFQHGGSSRRDNGEGHDKRGHEAVADAEGHGLHQALDDARREDDGQEDADGRQGRRHDRHAHLLCALHGGAGRRDAPAAQTVDVLDDDDGVIHQHTDAQRQAGQRHDVQVHAGEVHQHHSEQDRQRDAEADDEGGLDIPQEEGQHDDGQCRTDDHAAQDALDDDGDIVALVGQNDHMQAVVLGFQLLEGGQAVVRHFAGAGGGALVDLQHGCALAVQAGVAGLGVVDDLNVGHVRQADIPEAVHMEQQSAGDILDAVVFLADLQQPALAAGILDVTGGHREVLGIDELCQRVDVQQLGDVGAGHRLFFSVRVGLLCLGELLFVLVQHLAGFGELHISLHLLLRVGAQCIREGAHQAGDIVHGLDDVVQGIVDRVQALLHLQIIGEVCRRAALGTSLGVQALLQLLQCAGQFIGDIAQLGHDLNEGVDVLHARLVELVHDPLQAVAHVDQGLLDLRLLHHGDELVHAVQQGLCLLADGLDRLADLAAELLHHRIRNGLIVIFELAVVFLAARFDLSLGALQLLARIGQLDVDHFQQLFVDGVDLLLAELDLHHLFDQAVGGHAGNAALALHVGHEGVADELRQVIHIAALAADGRGHKGVHVQAVLDDRRGQTAARQTGRGLIHLVRHLDHGAVHIRIIGELHQQKAVVLRRGGGNTFHARHGAQCVLHHVGDFALHTLRACTGVDRDHHQVRCIHVGQKVGLHVADGHKAQHQHHDDRHQHRERFFDTEFFHFILPFLCLRRALHGQRPQKGNLT